MAACAHALVGTGTVVERMEQVATDWEIFAGANCCFKGQEINTGHGQNRQLTKELDSGRWGERGHFQHQQRMSEGARPRLQGP